MMRLLLVAGLLLPAAQLQAAAVQNPAVQQVLHAQQQPDGVVFEIMAWEDHSWEWAAPLLRSYVDRIREKYPAIDIALISQGVELFDLSLVAALQNTPALKQLATLAAEGVHIHVAGDYARWKQLGENDFVDFAEVAVSGKALLEDYIELGFVHIRLELPDGID